MGVNVAWLEWYELHGPNEFRAGSVCPSTARPGYFFVNVYDTTERFCARVYGRARGVEPTEEDVQTIIQLARIRYGG